MLQSPFKLMFCSLWVLFLAIGQASFARSEIPPARFPKSPFVADVKHLTVLCYHDVRNNLRDFMATSKHADVYALDSRDLAAHLSFFHANGYQPVSVDQVLAAWRGEKDLPEKAIFLTFDDGYESFYTKIYPLLKQYNYPAVFAIVGSWIQVPEGGSVDFGGKLIPREEFLTWDQMREMQASGLIEFASHSNHSHLGVFANPQGNTQPAYVTRLFDSKTQTYETEENYEKRVKADIKLNNDLLELKLGKRPRVMVWPFGAYNQSVAKFAAEQGMSIAMNLEVAQNLPGKTPLMGLRRHLVAFDTGVADVMQILRGDRFDDAEQHRVIHVDLDYIYDPSPEQTNKNIGILVERIARYNITTVYLQAYADPDGDGVADALYFPNRHLPVRADLFNRVAWQLKTRGGVDVYAWMPVSAFKLPNNKLADHSVKAVIHGNNTKNTLGYHRLSIFSPEARKLIKEIYIDLGRHAKFTGVLFHDDATLNDFEDDSSFARKVYAEQWKLPADLTQIRENPELFQQWSKAKTTYLNQFIQELIAILRAEQPALKTARNLYAPVVLDEKSETWFAQSYKSALEEYDFVAVMAMPLMEKAQHPEKWLANLANKVLATPQGKAKTIFEIQAVDWNTKKPIPDSQLLNYFNILRNAGIRKYGYYPDDFLKNQPSSNTLRPVMSLQKHPFLKPQPTALPTNTQNTLPEPTTTNNSTSKGAE